MRASRGRQASPGRPHRFALNRLPGRAGAAGLAIVGLAALAIAASPGRAVARQDDVALDEWTGRVVAQSTLEPVARARVTVERVHDDVPSRRPAAPVHAASAAAHDLGTIAAADSDGTFRIRAPRGTRLRLAAAGFLDGFVALAPGRETALGTLVLRHELSFSGRLLVNGEPAAQALVSAPGGKFTGNGLPSPEARADEEGRFRINGI